jgi:hypothetical protein
MIDQRIEQQGQWENFHRHLIVAMFETLRDQLGDEYLVDFETEVLFIPRPTGSARPVSPDVQISSPGLFSRQGSIESVVPTPAVLEVDEALDEFEQYAIEIRRRDQPDSLDLFGMQVVSVIELVSPTNKGVYGPVGRRKFLNKRQGYLASEVSYTEIDLLDGGQRTLLPTVEQLEEYHYIVWASQAQVQARHHWGWGWEAADPIPTITLPLDFPNVHIFDLGECYRQAYEQNRWPIRL